MDAEVLVIGGGISGLTCAHYLHTKGINCLLLESSSSVGGNVKSEHKQGFLLELGPHTFLASARDIFKLSHDLGLDEHLLCSKPQAADRYLVCNGKAYRAPKGPVDFISSPILPLSAKIRLLCEPFIASKSHPDDSVTRFFQRRFGHRAGSLFASAATAGVYAGDPNLLSAASCYPNLWRYEHESGSLIKGLLAEKKAKRKQIADSSLPERKGLYSFTHGLGELSLALSKSLGERILCASKVQKIERLSDGFVVDIHDKTFTAKKLVLATPPHISSYLASEFMPDLSKALAQIPTVPMAAVHVGFKKRIDAISDAFGVIAPRGQKVRTLGVLFPARLFKNRTPQDSGDLFTAFIGGAHDKKAIDLSDNELYQVLKKDLESMFPDSIGLLEKPDLLYVKRWQHAIPQLNIGHDKILHALYSELNKQRNLALCGNYIHGVGIKDAIRSGIDAAEKII